MVQTSLEFPEMIRLAVSHRAVMAASRSVIQTFKKAEARQVFVAHLAHPVIPNLDRTRTPAVKK
jgi:hypothetical protein